MDGLEPVVQFFEHGATGLNSPFPELGLQHSQVVFVTFLLEGDGIETLNVEHNGPANPYDGAGRNGVIPV